MKQDDVDKARLSGVQAEKTEIRQQVPRIRQGQAREDRVRRWR